MAEVFVSHARADQAQAAAIAEALSAGGRSVWWDRRLQGGADRGPDHAQTIERELDTAGCVVACWSAMARESLWVRAEANAALDAGKLVHLSLDGARPPVPFTALPALSPVLSVAGWNGARDAAPWPDILRSVEARLAPESEAVREAALGRRPDAGGVPIVEPVPERALQGFATVAWLGWAALAIALTTGVATLAVARGGITAATFGVLGLVAFAGAVTFAVMAAYLLVRVARASRR